MVLDPIIAVRCFSKGSRRRLGTPWFGGPTLRAERAISGRDNAIWSEIGREIRYSVAIEARYAAD